MLDAVEIALLVAHTARLEGAFEGADEAAGMGARGFRADGRIHKRFPVWVGKGGVRGHHESELVVANRRAVGHVLEVAIHE